MEISDKIVPIFDGKNVFITGATGFMGQVFIERLLRTTNVNKIFIFVRPKRNKSCVERISEILSDPLFGKIKEEMSVEMIMKKIHIIEGDCAQKNLLLSDSDRQLITENVSMIYHFAAVIKFNERFKHAVELNLRGTHEMMLLAKDCKNLELFCHMSTAYCKMSEIIMLEKLYSHPADPFEVIEIVENHSEDEVEEILSKYLDYETMPNSYCFTKSLTEKLIAEMNKTFKLPIFICRPGLVSSMLSNPVKGWTDANNTISALIATFGTGIFRTMFLEGNKPFNINMIPVDIAIGNIMLCSWSYLQESKTSEILIFNLENSRENILNHIPRDYESIISSCSFKYMLWYPRLDVSRVYFIHLLRSICFQWAPAILIDAILKLCGKKPFLMKTQRKITLGLKVLEPFTSHTCVIRCDKIEKMYKSLNENELKIYTMRDYDPKVYISVLMHGIPKFFMKQDEESIKKARTRLEIIYTVDRVVKIIVLIGIFKLILYIFGLVF